MRITQEQLELLKKSNNFIAGYAIGIRLNDEIAYEGFIKALQHLSEVISAVQNSKLV